MNSLRLTPAALKDLKEIKRYISEELKNPSASITTVKLIVESYEKLKKYPLLGPSLSKKIDIVTAYRYLISGNYIIFYKADNKFISIYRILYAGSHYLKKLFK